MRNVCNEVLSAGGGVRQLRTKACCIPPLWPTLVASLMAPFTQDGHGWTGPTDPPGDPVEPVSCNMSVLAARLTLSHLDTFRNHCPSLSLTEQQQLQTRCKLRGGRAMTSVVQHGHRWARLWATHASAVRRVESSMPGRLVNHQPFSALERPTALGPVASWAS